jgi:tetratricopeptide (TPR) repeat protein
MRRAGGLLFLLLAALSLVLNPYLYSQNNSGDETRKKAFELFNQDRQLEALPLFEELALKSPDDRDVLLGLGACLVAQAASLDDQEASTRERLRARQVLLKAKKLGQNSGLLENLLQMIPEDGVMKYDNTPADQAMKAAEAAFSRRDFDAAIENYSKVLKYDPKNYEAVLFIGDTYFAKKDWQQAAVWYQKAIDMDPNRETAHRYYADMLMKNGDMANSRTQFMQAVVAEPYNAVTWRGLKAWADTNKLQLKRVHIDVPDNVTQKDAKNITITVDPKAPEDVTAVWLIYGVSKVNWRNEEFKKHFPEEKQYRHSLPEEAEALSTAATVLTESNDSNKKKKKASSLPKDPNLLMLLKLKQANLIEPYVLLNGADEGIAQDYAGYREKNREKLVEYLSEFVVPPAP